MALRRRQQHIETNPHHRVKITVEESKGKSNDAEEKIGNDDILLDEDEQETLIQQIHDDYLQQSQRIEYIFTSMCHFIIPILSCIYAIFLHYYESKHRNINTAKPFHDKNDATSHLHHKLMTLRLIHLILNVIIHWYIPKGIFRKPMSPRDNITCNHTSTTTVTAKAITKTGDKSTTTVSLTLWYGVYLPYFLTLLITAIVHWMIRHQQAQSKYAQYGITTVDTLYNYYHSTLCISATIFFLSAWYIQHDHHEHIYQTINDLKSYKYQYKSL